MKFNFKIQQYQTDAVYLTDSRTMTGFPTSVTLANRKQISSFGLLLAKMKQTC